MAAYARPDCRSDDIEAIINSVARYDPQNVGVLEEYLGEQVKTDTWDLMGNLALLKLIQFNPELVQASDDSESPDTTQLVIVKAIAHAPFDADYSLCVALLGDRMSTLLSTPEQIKAYQTAEELSSLLRNRNFTQFWSTFDSPEVQDGPLSAAIHSLPSFANLVRRSIAISIANTFRSLQRSRAEQWLGMKSSNAQGLEDFAKSVMNWTVEGDSVQIPSNEANDPKNTVQSETVDLSRLVRTLAQSVQV